MKTAIFLLVLFSLFSWPILGRAEEPDMRKFSDEVEKTAKKLQEKIQEEIKTLGEHPWAGEYYEGDGLGVNVSLSITPKAGYLYEWHGCMGLYDRNYGAVKEKDGKLLLSFTLKHQSEGRSGACRRTHPHCLGRTEISGARQRNR